MRILFTGASSFTGFWFIRELVAAGHEVVATMRRQPYRYTDELRAKRIGLVKDLCEVRWGTSFGDDKFFDLVREGRWDLLCHHAAEATNYKDPNFDVVAALRSNTQELPKVLDLLHDVGCGKIILTGSVFENDEGAGSEPREAFSPYGLSKALTWQAFRHYATVRYLTLGKFVIPNPFGSYEEPRFTHYLIKNWFSGMVPSVNTPAYVRDNIHVSLLAKMYLKFAEGLSAGQTKLSPSGYIESQGAFARRLSLEMAPRLDLPCDLKLNEQTDFSEPMVRTNTDPAVSAAWSEKSAWDEMAKYYSQTMR
jgi:nucleoside-diphosphate-sugar epimerase